MEKPAACGDYVLYHQLEEWPDLQWDAGKLAPLLAAVRHRQGHLLGQMKAQGFRLRAEVWLENLTAETVKSSAIEGETLDADQVRSSIARHPGIDAGGLIPGAAMNR